MSLAVKLPLLTKTKSLNYSTIAIDVAIVEILKELAALTYKHSQRACSSVILVILLQVLCEVLDTECEQCNLALSRTCIGCIASCAELAEDLSLLVLI